MLLSLPKIVQYFFSDCEKRMSQSWRKFRIGIQSKRIRTISSHSEICFRSIQNHSELIRKTFCILFHEKGSISIRFNPVLPEASIRISLRSDWYKPNFHSKSFRPRIYLDLCLGLKRNESDWVRSIFDRFSSDHIQNVILIDWETYFGMAQNNSDSIGLNSNPKLSLGNALFLFDNHVNTW